MLPPLFRRIFVDRKIYRDQGSGKQRGHDQAPSAPVGRGLAPAACTSTSAPVGANCVRPLFHGFLSEAKDTPRSRVRRTTGTRPISLRIRRGAPCGCPFACGSHRYQPLLLRRGAELARQRGSIKDNGDGFLSHHGFFGQPPSWMMRPRTVPLSDQSPRCLYVHTPTRRGELRSPAFSHFRLYGRTQFAPTFIAAFSPHRPQKTPRKKFLKKF